MLRLAKKRGRKPFYLLSTVHRRRLEKLEREARIEYESLQQQNIDISKDNVEENKILAECSQIVSVSSDASDDVQSSDNYNKVDEVLSSSDDYNEVDEVQSSSDDTDCESVLNRHVAQPENILDNFQERLAEAVASNDMSHTQINAVLQVIPTDTSGNSHTGNSYRHILVCLHCQKIAERF